ncbi:hypothetical protein [Veronia nyctiphanis]|uniref:hypothetical protein n=1 Tax=Veronia nyctiphanis TaxID=1278244 RepID=UPI001F1AE621|nr:hypothetical protein [Veronia nyctiphanis]
MMNDTRTSHTWLPAIEVFGEGIFIELSQKSILDWEANIDGELKRRIEDTRSRHGHCAHRTCLIRVPSS